MKRILLSFVLLFIAGALFAQTIPVTDLNGVAVGVDTTTSFTEDAGPVLIAQNALVDDPDAAGTILSMTITVTNDLDGIADTLYLNAAATTAASGASITVTAYNDATGALVLSGSSLEINYQSVLQGVQYENLSDAPTETDRSITVVVTDLDGSSVATTSTVSVSGVNDTPATDLNGAPVGVDTTTAFTEDGGAVLIAENALVSDVDSGDDIESMTITVTNDLDGVADTLYLNGAATTAASGASITVTPYNDGTGVLAFSGTATPAEYESVLQGVQYENLSDNPTETDRAITVVVNDGTVPSVTTTSTVSVTAANDPPVTDLNGAPVGVDTTTAFTEDGGAVLIAENALVSDVDTGDDIESMTITVTNDLDGVADTLYLNGAATTAASGASITVTPYDDGTGILAFSGAATPAEYQSVLQGVQYENLSDNPTETDRAITVVVNDGDDPSVSTTSTVSVTAVNDAPEIANLGGDALGYAGGSGIQNIDQATAAVLTDVDNANFNTGNLTVTISNNVEVLEDSLAFNTGSVTLEGPLSGDDVTVGGQIIGTLGGNLGLGNDLIVDFNALATIARVQTLIQAITYENVDPTPTASARTVRVTVDDGEASNSTSANYDVTVTVSTQPEMDIDHNAGANALADGGAFDFGDLGIGSTLDTTFTIENNGSSDLALTGTPVDVTGGQFTIQGGQPSSPISAGSSETFTVRFTPTGGVAAGTISIANDDSDENPYNFTLVGNGTTTVSSIVRADANNTNAASVDWTVTFAHAVSNLTAANFSLATPTGDLTGYSLTAFADGGSSPSTTWTVTASGGTSGTGDLRLDFDDGTGGSLSPQVSNTLNGEVYALDLDAPSAPSAPNMTAATDLGVSNSDDETGDDTPDFSGTGAEAGATVNLISDQDGAVGSDVADGSGNWTITASALSENTHSLTVTQTDAANNTSPASTALSGVVIDKTPAVFNAISIASNNEYIDLSFDDGVFGTTTGGIVSPSNFNISIGGGTATSPVIDAVTTQGPELDAALQEILDPLMAGETDYRLWISYSGTANGSETVTIAPDNDNGPATPMADDAGRESINPQAGFNEVGLNALTIPQIVSTTWLDQNSDGSIDAVEVRFDIDVNIVDQGNNNDFNNFDINGDIGGSSAQSGAITAGNPFTLTFTPADKGTTGTTNITGLTLSYERGGTNDKIRSVADNSEVVDEFLSPLHIDDADPFFESAPVASGHGGNAVFGGTELITIDVDLGETGLDVTGDLTNVFGIYSAAEDFDDDGDGTYSFTTFQARFLNHGDDIQIDITAQDAAGNSTTNTTLEVDIDSEAPDVSIDRIVAFEQAANVVLTGEIDDIAAIIDVTVDGTTYATDGFGAGNFTNDGSSWTLTLTTPATGEYDIDVDVEDTEGNSASESLTDGLIVSAGITISATDLSDLCFDGTFLTLANIDLDETTTFDFAEGNNQTFTIKTPNGFEFNDAGSPSVNLSGAGLTGGSIGFISPQVAEITFSMNGGEAATNQIQIAGLEVKTTSNISTNGDIVRLGGSAQIPGFTADTVLVNVSSNIVTRPSTDAIEYCEKEDLDASDLSTNSSTMIWYDDFSDVYTIANAVYNANDDGIIDDLFVDLGVDSTSANVYTFYVTDYNGTCESDTATVTITINPNPVVDPGTDLTGAQAVCSGEPIVLGGAPTLATGTGSEPYDYIWFSNVGDVSFTDDELTGQDDVANPSINAPINPNGFGNADETIRYYVAIVDNKGCIGIDSMDVQVHPAIDPTLNLDPFQTDYSEFFGDIVLDVTPAATSPFTNGVISGTAVSYDGFDYVFNTESAGVGTHPVQYTYTDGFGCTEASGFTNVIVSNTASGDVDGLAGGYCINAGAQTVSVSSAYQTQFNIDFPAHDAIITYYNPTLYPFPYTGTPGPAVDDDMSTGTTTDDDYFYDPQEHFDVSGVYGGNYVLILGTQPADTLLASFQYVELYQIPNVQLAENVGNFSDNNFNSVPDFYCEDEGTIQFTHAVGGTESGNGTYYISRIGSNPQPFVAFSGDMDTSNPHPNDLIAAGDYQVVVDSDGSDDPLSNSCSNTDTVSFTIIPRPAAQQLNLTGSTKGIASFDADPNSGADYTFNYCDDETSFETLRVQNIDPDERVTWYDESLSVLGTSTADGSKISGSELFATASAFPPDPDVYTFYYSVTDFIGASAGFEGCEGDLTQVQINVYPEVVNPPIDLTSSTRGEDKSTGSAENYFVFEYCQGETVEDLAVVQDNLTENFDGGVPTGWSQVGASPSGAALARFGAGNAIRLNTGNASNEVVTADYQSIQRISFYYRTVAAGGTGANILVEVSGDEGDYALNLPLTNSTTYELFEADVLGSLTNADITISVDGLGDEDMIIDDFSVASTIPNKTFYQWFDDSNNPIAVSATGGVTASATELLGTTTPAAATYTFYVNKIENINTTDSPNFDGCEGETTQIDIVVYPIPAAPTGFDTDINAHSGELNINTRILSTALVDVPGSANVDYIWSATNTIGATDTINSSTGTSNNPDLTYGQLLSNLTSSIADPSGYYTVSSTYNGSAYLFQVTNELNRQTSVFPGCGSITGTQVDFTIYPLAEKPILSDTNDISKTNLFFDDNSTGGDLTDDIGENLELNFCAGDLAALDSISIVSRYLSSNDREFTWYRSNIAGTKLQEINIGDADGSFATASELFLTGINNDLTTYYLVTQTTDIESGTYDGGESDSVRLKVNIYNIPSAPESAIAGDSTEFYYCFGEPIRDLVVEGESPAQFYWYASEADAQAGTNRLNGGSPTTTLTAALMDPDENGLADLTGTPVAGTYTFYATQVTDFSVTPETDFVSPSFVGCEGQPIEFTIYVRSIPQLPDVSFMEQFLCETENASPFSITNRATGALVTWYEDNQTTIRKSAEQNSFDPDDVGDGGIVLPLDITTRFYVGQRTDSLFNGSEFIGCISPLEYVEVTQFEKPLTPTVTYEGTSSNPATPTTIFEAGVCEGSTDSALELQVSSTQESPAYFKWYSTDASGVINQLVFTTGQIAGNAPITVTGADLNLETATEGVRYFKVAQVAEFADFDGCETVTANMQRVQINIFRSPAFPTFSVADNDAFSTTNNTTQFYLVYDSTGMSLYNDQLKNDVFTATGTNTAGVPGALTNTAPQEYNWYYNSSLELADDPTADFDDLNMTSILPRDNGGFNNPTTIETYSYEVRQGQFRGQNANPEACESPSQFVDVNIIPVPETPTPAAVLVELCEDETVGSLSITNRAPGAQVHWFNEDPRVNPNADTLNSIADFTYVPTEVQGNDGTYTYYVRQVTNVEIGGTNFQGAVSDVAIVTVTVYPNAGVPESTAENNRYVYCIGERIENLQVVNPETGVTYAWYGDINLNSFLGNTTSNNNNLIPSLNGAFDENTVGTYNYYVTSTLAGQGCESSPTLVQVIINGLPDPEIKFDTGIAFENEEDVPEFYQICVDESPLSIIGSSEGSSFGTFTGDGVVQGTNGRATFDPLLALGIADPLDMPEFGIDTIMVNYNLANSNDCDDNFQVGFVVTALPRPNFEASISSPINVPVLIEDEDLGVACVDVDPNNLATVTRLTLRASGGRRTGEFIISNALRDTTLAIANGSVEFDLDLWSNPSRTQDTLFIRYVFADAFGCSYFKDKKIVLHENPMVEFENIVGCIGEPATFTARALVPFTNDDIEFWDWTLINNQTGQIAETTSFADGSQSIVTTISDPSTYRVSVRGRSAKYEPINNLATCVSIDESTINGSTPDVDEERDEVGNTQLVPIGDFPEVDFSWRFITENEVTTVEGKETDLEDLKDVNGDPLNGVSQVWMDWGDGTAIDTLLANEGIGEAFGFENHTYTADGWYDAKLKISTINGCVDSVTKVIKILPHIVVDPALGVINSFEASTQSEAGWFVDETEMGSVADKTTSWTYGPIDGSIAQNGFAGSQGWSTDEGGAGYQEDDGSWVFSPSYDISAFEKPMVVFKGHYEFAQNDGAIMEYSIDNGASWNILGRYISGDEEGTGIYWYGTLDIRADPGEQRSVSNLANASGWGFPSAMIDGQGEGIVSSIRHKLDEIPVNGRQNVRFRFHFAATSANGAPGIVFDDFAIVERGRISLIEQFSNSNSNQDRGGFVQGQYTSLALNNEVNARLDSTLLNNNDLVAVNYYTEIYGNDPLFEVNEEGPSARTLFYGLNNVTSILDGDVLEGTNLSTEAASPPWSGAESNRNTLRDAEFDLQLVLNSSDNDEISVTVEVTPQKDFVGNDIRVYLAVVEKVLTGEVLPNGEFDPRNVFRKFLPSPLGHEVNDLNEGSVTTLTETWKIDARKVLDPDQLAIVAFVQKANGDREVYQAARVDINGKTSILGVGDLIEVDDLNLYPNPANDAFFVTFDLTLEEDFQWRLFDQTGRLMKKGQVFKGMDGFRVESAGLPSGLYLMSIGNETKQYTHLKVIVKH